MILRERCLQYSRNFVSRVAHRSTSGNRLHLPGNVSNRRKVRDGAFGADRYHATALETGTHLARCLVYIDLNMVRAGVVAHPAQWEVADYHEIQRQRQARWTESVAAVGREFVTRMQHQLGPEVITA